MDTQLIKSGDLQAYVADLRAKQTEIIYDCEKILPYIKGDTIKRSIQKRLVDAKQLVEALDKGYIPVLDTWGFHRTDIKSRWGALAVKRTLDSMPEEVKAVWEKVKVEGFFDHFSVTTRDGGDPLLVGVKGRRRYLIAGWLNIAYGAYFGFAVKK